MTAPIPAPWHLTGKAMVAVYRLPRTAALDRGLVPAALAARYAGGPAALMLVDYQTSEAGPYRELLWSPGRFDFSGRKLHSITKIFVSTPQSVEGGRANWGIPKELARFDFRREGRTERFVVRVGERTALEIESRDGWLRFPVTAKLLPLAIAQELDGKRFYTRFDASGWVRTARLTRVAADASVFPDVSTLAPLAVASVGPFSMTFRAAAVEPWGAA